MLEGMIVGGVVVTVLIVIDVFVYLRTPFEKRSTWPWWRYLLGGAIVAHILERTQYEKQE